MSFTTEQTATLAGNLDIKHVASRNQAGRSLSYIEGWHALAEANRIFGFDGWQSETVAMQVVAQGERTSKFGKKLMTCTYTARCRITVYAGDRVIVREGVGAGHGMDEDAGQAHEKAIKEAETDSRKRALMTFGNKFGLALYDKTQASVSEGADDVPAAPQIAPPAPLAIASPVKELDPPAFVRPQKQADRPAARPISVPATAIEAVDPVADVDPRIAALNKKAATLSQKDSQGVFDLLKLSLEFCDSLDSLRAWAHANGAASGKQDGLRDEHKHELRKLAQQRQAEFKRRAA